MARGYLSGYLVPAANSEVEVGGVSVPAFYAPLGGAVITNPLTGADQGITPVGVPTYAPEPLYVDLTGPAGTAARGTTVALRPGESLRVPPTTLVVWVNAASSGHRFSAFASVTVSYPPTPYAGSYPPAGPTTRLATIPAYLYQQYQDDDDLQYFTAAYNGVTQTYVDWFNGVLLPIYPQLSGYLLDWVGTGLYGLPRPTLFSYRSRTLGPFNTYALNAQAMNTQRTIGASNVAVTTDDVYKRIITWHFYKGDGRAFSIAWLKRRVLRFLYGENGTDPGVMQVDDYAFQQPASGFSDAFSDTFGTGNLPVGRRYLDATQISVEVGAGGALTITIVAGIRRQTGGAVFNTGALNTGPGCAFNAVTTVVSTFNVPAMAATFKEAMESGALEMPAQYATTVNIGVL